jgi:hypothetical protein
LPDDGGTRGPVVLLPDRPALTIGEASALQPGTPLAPPGRSKSDPPDGDRGNSGEPPRQGTKIGPLRRAAKRSARAKAAPVKAGMKIP